MNLDSIDSIREGNTGRISSYEKSGGNADFIRIPPGESIIIADIQGPGRITHLWMTSWGNYRNILLKMTLDNNDFPSVHVPYGDFFGQGNCYVNSFQSAYFTSSTDSNNKMNELTAMNCYLPMPFRTRATIELINESDKEHIQYYYIDYETYEEINQLGPNPAYLHSEFRSECPFRGWGPEIRVNTPESDSVLNIGRKAWENNYIIMETKGKGHYIGCFFNVINTTAKEFGSYELPNYSWWGEGDDMIWVDGYKWPPDIHGTGSEDYFNQALGMQRNAFLRNGTAIHEFDTGGYSTSYVFHIENPVRFQKEIKVTIEIGHANHLGNDISSVAFWYAQEPTPVISPPSVKLRQPRVKKDGIWVNDKDSEYSTINVEINDEMRIQKRNWTRQTNFPFYRKSVCLITNSAENMILMLVSTPFGGHLEIYLEEILEDLVEEIASEIENNHILIQIFEQSPYLFHFKDVQSVSEEVQKKLKDYGQKRVKIVC